MWSCESSSYYLLQAEGLYERCMPEKNAQIVLKNLAARELHHYIIKVNSSPTRNDHPRPVTLCCLTPPPLSISRASFYEQ